MANFTLIPEWREVLSACDKTQFGAITRLSGRLSDRLVTPKIVTDVDVSGVLLDFENEGRSAAIAQTNAFIKHFNQLGKDHPELGLPALKPIPSPRRDRKLSIQSLPMQLRCDTAWFVLQRPNENTVQTRRNSIYRAASAIQAKGLSINRLVDLLQPDATRAVARSFGPIDNRNRTRTGTLSVLMAAAKHLKDESAYGDICGVISKCAADNPEISARTIRVCAPFHDHDYREAVLEDFVCRADLPAELTEKSLYDTQGALLALLLIRCTLKPGFIVSFEFNGGVSEPFGERRRLSHPDIKIDFEALLREREIAALNLYHARLTEHLGRSPKGPFVTMAGDPRGESTIHSLKQVLTAMGLRNDKMVDDEQFRSANGQSTSADDLNMQALDLRDLGVRIRLQSGKLTIEQIAALALYNAMNFEIRFKPWINSLRRANPTERKQ